MKGRARFIASVSIALGSWAWIAQPIRVARAEDIPADAAPDAWPPPLRAIQQSPGGPVAQQFDALDAPSPGHYAPHLQGTSPAAIPAHEAPPSAGAVAALRKAAAQLDGSANRLEEQQLYRQADALRQVAQQLRWDARRLAAASARPAPIDVMPLDPIPLDGADAARFDHADPADDAAQAR